MGLDAARYPRVAAYLGSVPKGLAAHPECRVTAAAVRQFLEALPVPPDGLPSELGETMKAARQPSAWVQDACFIALVLAMADHHRMGDDAFVARNREVNKELLGGRFFKVLMSLASPMLLLSGAEHRWSAMRQGSRLKAERERRQQGRSVVRLDFPDRLYPPLVLRCFGTGFDAALELSNAKSSKVELVESDERHASYLAEWT